MRKQVCYTVDIVGGWLLLTNGWLFFFMGS